MLSPQERRRLFSVFLLLQIFCACFVTINGDNEQEKKLYIVYMGDSPKPVFMSSLIQNSAADEHVSMLKNVVGSPVAAKESITRSYVNHFNAFAAKLSPEEAKQLQNKKNVISVFPNGYKTLHTTKSWDFLGFPETVRRDQKLESNLVVGVLDSGITPDSESFNDKGFGPPPAKWKGTCGPFVNFTGCNNKIVGARYFKLDGTVDLADVLSPIDLKGHGTHTASTIVGNAVHDASLFGVAKGTARGAVPSARVAMYKVCWVTDTCSDIDILAAFEAAIEDGVDIISISLGSNTTLRDNPHNYFQDVIAIGSFHAMKKGILTVASAGNNGPSLDTVDNHAPWVLTVGATGTNRQYRSKIKLGNGQILSGIGMNTFDLEEKLYPLITGEAGSVKLNPSAYDPYMDAGLCKGNVLDTMKVKGKLVVCGFDEMSDQQHPADFVVSKSGGIGTIVIDNYGVRTNDTAGHYQCPGTMVNTSTGGIIASYIKSTSSPTAVIYKTEEVNVSAPFVPQFSGRGPNKGSRRLLKPDITAPGVDILAAYTPFKSVSGVDGDTRVTKYNTMSGTSMSCPHVAGVAAYVKSFHPDWSPAAIKSAIMTTATPMNAKTNWEAELAYGAGQVNPVQAVDPGLIYDMAELPYIQFLCQEGYSNDQVRIITSSKSVNCAELPPPNGNDALNYPTMQVSMTTNDTEPATAVFNRTATNVGPERSIYNATIIAPKDVEITVNPTSLVFTAANQSVSFSVVVKAKKVASQQEILSGSLTWKSTTHSVRSPIVVFTSQPEVPEAEAPYAEDPDSYWAEGPAEGPDSFWAEGPDAEGPESDYS